MSKTLKLADYLGKPFDCSCGRTHSTTLEGVTVSAGAMKALPEYVEKYGFKNLYIACDEITYGIAGEKVMNILKDAGIKAKAHVFKGKRFIPDEKALGELMIDADRDCDLVVAVGTGSINDMCRFLQLPDGSSLCNRCNSSTDGWICFFRSSSDHQQHEDNNPGSDTAVYYRRYRYSLWSTCKNGICRTWRSAW